MHSVAEGSASPFLTPPSSSPLLLFLLLFFGGIYLFTLREKIRNCWLSIRKYPNIVECRRLLRCVGNVAVVSPDPAVTHTMKGMPSSVSPVDRDGLKSNGNHATPRFGVNTMELPVCVHAGHLCFLLLPPHSNNPRHWWFRLHFFLSTLDSFVSPEIFARLSSSRLVQSGRSNEIESTRRKLLAESKNVQAYPIWVDPFSD
jgi:hypothetical protein